MVSSLEFVQPKSLAEALASKAEAPGAVPIAGGTDLLVELNFDRRRPELMLDLGHVEELRTWSREGDSIRLGAGVTYTELVAQLAAELPGLAIASRTVGSPQIRNRGTVGGNLGTASPAGDALPPLVASGAEVELQSAARGTRRHPVADWIQRPKHSVIEPDELIVAVHVPIARGPQQFSKIGTRNAMVISVASFALSLDPVAKKVGTCIGSAGPTMLVAREAQEFLEGALAEVDGWESPAVLDGGVVARFGELVARAARPIDDVRGSAAYRRRALEVMARRTLGWTWSEYQKAGH